MDVHVLGYDGWSFLFWYVGKCCLDGPQVLHRPSIAILVRRHQQDVRATIRQLCRGV
jgi:hypothetical protein